MRGDWRYGHGTVLAVSQRSITLFKGKPSVTAGRKAKGSRSRVRQPGCQSRQRPHVLENERGAVLREGPSSTGFVSLTSGSRAHDVGQAITPQGRLWGVLL